MQTLNALLIDLYDSAQHCNVSDYNRRALKQLKRLVAFDSAALVDVAITPEQRVSLQTIFLDSTPIERFRDRVEAIGQESIGKDGALSSPDAIFASAFRQRGRSVVADVAESTTDSRTLSYCRKYDTAHSLAFISEKTFSNSIPALALWRARKQDSYRKAHSQQANLVIPHLIQARAINRGFCLGPARRSESSATVLANRAGLLYFIEDAGATLLQMEWPQWSPPFVPAPMIAALQSSSERMFRGRAITAEAQVLDDMLCLTLSANPSANARLTGAEYRTAVLAARGLQYKEIARELDISAATVRNHLHAAYRKLGVSNKTGLAAALPDR